MKKQLLITLVLFLSLCIPTFASGCNGGTTSLATSNNQKACKNVVSFIYIDFSFLSPKATAADLDVGCKPKSCKYSWMRKCSTPQCCADECYTPQCCPATCPQTCAPEYCPCVPQCPNYKTKSMAPDKNKQEIVVKSVKHDEMIPVAYKQETKPQIVKQKTKTGIFRINLSRCFKFQIL